MLLTRLRKQPDTTATGLHRILAIFGLGPSSDADAEAVCLITDRLVFATLFDDVDAAEHHSLWHSCTDRSLIRIFVEYAEANKTRQFIVAMRGHDGNVIYSRIIEPDAGISQHAADLTTLGRFKAIDGGESNINCLGMKEYKLILLAKAGGTHVDAYGGVA